MNLYSIILAAVVVEAPLLVLIFLANAIFQFIKAVRK